MRSPVGYHIWRHFGPILVPSWLNFGGPEAPETIRNRFWRASEGSLEWQSSLHVILAKNLDPTLTYLDLPGAQGRWEMF